VKAPGEFAIGGNAIPQKEKEEVSPKEQRTITTKLCDWIVNVSFVMLFFGLPLFFTGLNFQGLSFEKQMYFYFWILLALVFWAIKGVIIGEMKIRRTPLDIPILVFVVAYVLATIFSVDRWHSFWGYFGDPSRGLASVLALVIAYYLFFNTFTKSKIKWVMGSLVISNFLVVLWTILTVMNWNPLPLKMLQAIPASFMGSFTGLTIFFGFMMPLLVVAAMKIKQSSLNNVFKIGGLSITVITIVLNLVAFLALYAFIPWFEWMAIIVGVVIFLVFILSGIVKTSASAWSWLPASVFVMLMVLLIGGESINIARVNIPAEVHVNYDLSANIAKNALKENFVLGSGPATYGYNFSLFRDKDFNLNSLYNLRFYQGTGVFFEAPATVGMLGTVALVVALLSYLSVSFYLLMIDKDKDKLYSLGFFSSAFIFLLIAAAVRTEGSIIILGSLISAFALAVVLKESNSQEKYINLSLKASPKFALALAFIFMVISASVIFLFVFIGKAYTADIYAGLSARNQQVNEDSVNKIVRAISLYGNEPKYYVQLSQYFFVLANNEAMKKGDAATITGYLNNAVASATKARDLSKNDVSIVEALAQVYENSALYVTDSITLAEDAYKKALELEPHNPNFQLKLGQIKVAQAGLKKDEGEKKQLAEEAKGFFQKSVDEKANFDAGLYNLALVQEALGDVDGSIENMQKAYLIDRQNINYAFNLGRLYHKRGGDDDLKLAEILYKNSSALNEKEMNPHFYLGLLLEKMKEKDQAVAEYQKVIDLLPASTENRGEPADNKETETKLQEMIANVKNGTGNLNVNAVAPVTTDTNTNQ